MKKQKMSKKLLKSRKGVSGVISGIFVILICFLTLGALYTFAATHDRYNQVVNERSKLNWEIETEKFAILDGQRNDDGALNLTVFNYGGVAAHIVDVWVTHRNSSGSWQKLYSSDFWLNPAETIQNFGEQNVTLLPNGIQHEDINLSQPVVEGINYTVKLVSERGNTVSYLIKYEPSSEDYGPPMAYLYGSMRVTRDDIPDYGWRPANITHDDVYSEHLYIRVIVKNLLDETIIITGDSGFTVSVTGAKNPSQNYRIIGGLEDPVSHGWEGDLILSPGEESYIYFYVSDESLVLKQNNPVVFYTYAGIAAFTGTKSGEFWSGALLMDSILCSSEFF